MVFSGGGACVGYDEIRSMSGRYASYWNAFLWAGRLHIALFLTIVRSFILINISFCIF